MSGQTENGAPVAVGKAYDFVLTVGERLSAGGLDVLLLLCTRTAR